MLGGKMSKRGGATQSGGLNEKISQLYLMHNLEKLQLQLLL